jgi:histidinol-phosphate/aromatic aminotransferase/cobyric acid decarboxylase-like protein
VVEQRRRIERALHDLAVDATESQANFVWLHAAGITGAQLAGHLQNEVCERGPPAATGADDHVRASIRGAREQTDRLLSALEKLGTRN